MHLWKLTLAVEGSSDGERMSWVLSAWEMMLSPYDLTMSAGVNQVGHVGVEEGGAEG